MRHPNFFGFWTRPPGSCPDGPRQPAVLRVDHASVHLRFRRVPRLGFEHDFGGIAPPLSNRCQPAPERGRGGFRMGRTQPHGISAYHAARVLLILEVRPAYVSHTPPGAPAKSGTARPAHGQNGLAEPLRAKLWRGCNFVGYVH